MLVAPRYSATGEKVGEVRLDPAVFGLQPNRRLMHQAVTVQQANARAPIAHSKTRAEVRGGGRKPWRQKGTGRARHGSIRSPLWRGGGVVFGPRRTRNFSRRLPAKMRRQAILMALSDKAQHQALTVLEPPKLEQPKTKTLVTLLKKLPIGQPTLLVMPEAQSSLIQSARNVPWVTTIGAASLNVVDLLRHRSLVALDGALEKIAVTYRRTGG